MTGPPREAWQRSEDKLGGQLGGVAATPLPEIWAPIQPSLGDMDNAIFHGNSMILP